MRQLWWISGLLTMGTIWLGWTNCVSVTAQEPGQLRPTMVVQACEDFKVDGTGSAPAWEKAAWQTLNLRPGSAHAYSSRFKMLYSPSGLYVLFDGQDDAITATKREDFLDLWTEDVYECFFWTDTRHPLYFEYEISPLGFELPILVPNIDGQFLGWRPWHIGQPAASRASQRAVHVRRQAQQVTGWSAEVYLPYDLLKPLAGLPPKPGSKWRANFYRMDYDGGQSASWDWARVGQSFHEYQGFGELVFQ